MRRLFCLATGLIVIMGSASADPICPSGNDLKTQAVAADAAVSNAGDDIMFAEVSSELSRRARALAYFTYASAAGDAALDDLPIFVVPVLPCHADDCSADIALTRSERSQLRGLAMSDVESYETGRGGGSWASVLGEIATPARMAWAESVLQCSFDGVGTIDANPASPPQSANSSPGAAPYAAPIELSTPSTPLEAEPVRPSQWTERVYGAWAHGSGYYCRNNEYQTDLYAEANAREVCRERGGSDNGTVVFESGYDSYRPNAEQCYQARAYTDCLFFRD